MCDNKEHDRFAIIDIDKSRMDAFNKKVQKLNKKAVRFGLEPIQVIPTRHHHIETRDANNEKVFVPVVEVTIINPIPRIDGWELVARLNDESGEAIPTVTFTKNNFSPEVAALADNVDMHVCDHCHSNRVRKLAYILRNTETGEYQQVGSTCIQDFLGTVKPAAFEAWFGIHSLTDFGFNQIDPGQPNYMWAYPVRDIIAEAVAVIEYQGQYVSKARANEEQDKSNYGEAHNVRHTISTGDHVWQNIVSTAHPREATLAHKEQADVIIAWFNDFAQSAEYKNNDNEWIYKVVRCVTSGELTNEIGVTASAVVLYNKKTEKPVAASTSEHVGTIKERRDFTLTLKREYVMDTAYGPKTTFFAVDGDGNNINLTTTTFIAWKVGETKTFKATVKDHTTHDRFGKATWVFRAKEV